MIMRSWLTRVKVLGITLLFCLLTFLPAWGQDQATLERLEKIIKQQQAQIEAQQKALKALQGEVEALKRQPAEATAKSATDKPVAVTNSVPKAKVKIYGQVDKAVLYSNDGNDGNVYLVDNDNSSTRIGFLGAVTPNDRWEIGTRIEVEYQTNPSNLVSQEDRRIDNTEFEKRQLYLYVKDNRLGELSLGWGSTASDTTSEVDLSGTSVVGYSDIASMAGGQLFYNENTGTLSTTAIRNVFNNMDGLGRDERIRYDSPSFGGLVASGSYINDGGGDLAVRYDAQMGSFKLASAVAFSNPGSTSATIDDTLNGSVSLLHDSGFNGTFAMGTRSYKVAGRDDGAFFYTKFGYRANWCPLGVTSLAVDYGHYSDVAVNGDDADTMGFQMVQDLYDWGSEVFLGYRFHKLDRDAVDFDNINAVMTGMRVKF